MDNFFPILDNFYRYNSIISWPAARGRAGILVNGYELGTDRYGILAGTGTRFSPVPVPVFNRYR